MAFTLPAVLRLPNFRYLVATRLFGTLAIQGQAVIIGWQLFTITQDPLMLGLIGLTEALPTLCAALFAGHFVDTRNPAHLYRAACAILSINLCLLMLVAGGIVAVPMEVLIPYLFVGVFISGLVRSITMPASSKLLSEVVQPDEIPQAAATMSSVFQIGAVVGPAIAGIIYGFFGPLVAWITIASWFIIATIATLFLDVPYTPIEKEYREPMMDSIKAGWSFILGNNILLSVMALDMFAVLFGGAVAMLPAFAGTILSIGAEGLGVLRAAPAIGSSAMALYLAMRPMRNVTGRRLLLVVAGFGLCMIGFGLSNIFWVSCLFLFLSGLFDSVSVVIRETLMQWLTPNTMRGRVSSINRMFITSSNEIGAFESGVAARLMGLVPSVVFGGGMSVLVAVLTAWRAPTLRDLSIHAETQNIAKA